MAILGKLTVTTPKFILPELTSLPFSSFQPCKNERQPIGALKEPVIFLIVSYIKTSGYIRLVERSEEHTSELQSRFDLVCGLLLEKKKERRQQIGISADTQHLP